MSGPNSASNVETHHSVWFRGYAPTEEEVRNRAKEYA